MHATTTCRIAFFAESDKLESVIDYLDRLQRGEYFFDEDAESVQLIIEEDFELACKDDIVDFIEKLYRGLRKRVSIHAVGTLNAIESDVSQNFECQCNENMFRYRSTDWSNCEIDTRLSYEEYEEENNIDIDEDEYGEHLLRAHEGIRDNSGEMYGDWEYVD